ncbi:MAG: tetratricopeptide repeat protein [Bacteroidaceae bacterium]|nr:tetratricopeptide repeat protein [Prevotellaceae bacterium]MDY5632816.1 tetratricopeptide repeat protein [Bacteroidaceae bacterium]
MDKELLQAAVAAITAALEQDAQNATLFHERGRLRFQLGDEEGAMQDLRKALELNPSIVSELANGSFQGQIGKCR